MAIDPSRLYTALLNTGLQQKDNALYQVIHDLIKILSSLSNSSTAKTNTVSIPTPIPIIQNTIIQMISESGDSDSEAMSSGSSSSNSGGTDAFIPYYIAPAETFLIPINKQGLFAMNIDNEGILVVDGFLIEV